MESFCLKWIGPVSLRLITVPAHESLDNLVKTFPALMLLLVLAIAAPKLSAQQDTNHEQTFGDAFTPLVYNVQNTGASDWQRAGTAQGGFCNSRPPLLTRKIHQTIERGYANCSVIHSSVPPRSIART